MEIWFVYLLTGGIVGFFAGLLGIGGGLMLVPVLTYIFMQQDLPIEYILHMALGTTSAIIMLTSISSLRAHHVRGAVDWQVVRYFSPGIILGALSGATLAGQLSGRMLSTMFVLFAYLAAIQMWFNFKPAASYSLPGKTGLFITGGVIGSISSLVAIGGGTLTVPFLTACKVKLHRAIGTSAAVGFPIAFASATGYALNGMWQTQPLPVYTLGYIYLPALVMVALASVITAPLGAKAAHAISAITLRKIFAGLLGLIGTKLLLDFWT